MELWTDPFLEYLKSERNYSSRTIESYSQDLLEFQEFLEEQNPEAEWKSVQTADVREWIIYLLDKRGISASYVNRKLSAMRTFYRYLRRMGWVSINPMERVVAPKKIKPVIDYVKESDMDKLLEMTAEDRSFEGIRDRLVLMMFYETGVRRAELLGMTDSCVDLIAKQIKVTGKRNKQRIIPFGKELEDEIRAYLDIRSREVPVESYPTLFVTKNAKPLSVAAVAKIVKENLSKVTTIKKRSPHVLRHSFATAMLDNEADLMSIQKLLGHESVATTQMYTHVSDKQLLDAYREAHPRK